MPVYKFSKKQLEGVQLFIRDQLAYTDMRELYNRVDEDWKAYDFEPPGYSSFEDCSNVRSDVVRNAVDAKVTLFEKGVLHNPDRFSVIPRTHANNDQFNMSDAASMLRKAWNYVFDHESRLTEIFRRDTRILCVQGYVVFKIRRQKRYHALPTLSPDAKKLDLDIREAEDYAQCNVVHYRNFICDPEYRDIQDAPMVGEVIQTTESQLRFWADQNEGWQKDAIEDVITYERGRSRGPVQSSESVVGGRVSAELPEPRDRPEQNPLFPLVEFYAEVPKEATGFEQPVRMYGVYHSTQERILYLNFLSFMDAENLYPFEVPVLYETLTIGKRWWGFGVPRWNKAMSDLVDDSLNRARDDALIWGRPPMITSERDSVLANEQVVIAPWARIRVTRPDAFQFAPFPAQNHQLHLEQLSIFQQRYERLTNVFPETLGDMGALKTHQAATSVTSVLNQANASHLMDAFRMVEAYQRILRRTAAIRAQILTERIVDAERIDGDTREPLMKVLTLDELALFVRLTSPDQVLNEYQWEFDVTGLQSQLETQKYLTALQLLQGAPIAAMFPERLNDLMVNLLALLEIPNTQKLRVTEEEIVDRQSTIKAETLLKATTKDREQFLEGIDPQVIQKFVLKVQQMSAAMGAAQGAQGGQQAVPFT